MAAQDDARCKEGRGIGTDRLVAVPMRLLTVACSLTPLSTPACDAPCPPVACTHPQFLYAGPLAFDPAKIIGELLIPYFASDGLGAQAQGGVSDRGPQREWLLRTIVDVWEGFVEM